MACLLEQVFAPSVSRIIVPVDRATVFSVLADPETYPVWLIGAERVRRVDAGFPRPGTAFDHSVGIGPLALDDRSESVERTGDRRLELRVHAGPFHAHVLFELEDRPYGATEVLLQERPTGPFELLTPVLRPALQARNALSLVKLRDLAVAREAA